MSTAGDLHQMEAELKHPLHGWVNGHHCACATDEKTEVHLGDLPKFPQLVSGRAGPDPVCPAQTLILFRSGDLLPRLLSGTWVLVVSDLHCDLQGCALPGMMPLRLPGPFL